MLKCEFGYENRAGKVVIPTVDTGDFLKQSKRGDSNARFNNAAVTETVKLPPFAADYNTN
jgi:hypothetical protein